MNTLQWFQVMLSYLFQASLVIGVAWGLDRWADAAQTKARIWSACYVSLLGLLAAAVVLPRLQWLHPWARLEPSELLRVANAEHVLGLSLLATWIFGTCVMLVRWTTQFVLLQQFKQSCLRVTSQEDARLVQLVAPNLVDVHGRRVEFRLSPEELGPFCYQFHQPIVFLPRSIIDGEEAVLVHVLHHELTHLQTQHPLQLFLQKVSQAILWFHPLVWMSCSRASLVREFVCDDASVHDGASTASYLRTLIQIVEERSKPQSGTLTIGRSAKELKIRARRLATNRPPTLETSASPPLSRIAVMVLFLAAMATSQLWLPTNPLAASQSRWSPWPTWSAATLHAFDLSVRDFEHFEHRSQVHELLEDQIEASLPGNGV